MPNWHGERMLRDSPEQIYEASGYALEYVFGQKQETPNA
jgi:hypothetical protein